MYFLYKNKYRILKSVEITIRRELRGKEKIRGDEPIQIVYIYIYIHIYVTVKHTV
jgi:hypothetical protein